MISPEQHGANSDTTLQFSNDQASILPPTTSNPTIPPNRRIHKIANASPSPQRYSHLQIPRTNPLQALPPFRVHRLANRFPSRASLLVLNPTHKHGRAGRVPSSIARRPPRLRQLPHKAQAQILLLQE